ncbi:glycosyl hydrolase family 18 protein, partial [Umezakia ovalisporum]
MAMFYEWNGSKYLLTGAGTWEEAQAQAQSLGGNLVTINSQAEQDWLVNTFGGSEQLWIGLTDKDTEADTDGTKFKWVSGETSTYRNFFTNEPNNAGNEDYVGMNYNAAGKWNDYGSGASLKGIIEIKEYNTIVGGYFPEWATYGRDFQVEDIPGDKLTHVFYAFTKIDENGEVAIYDPWAAIQHTFNGKYTREESDQGLAGNFAELQALKQEYPHLKTMMSIGGWSLSGPFSDTALTEASREKFAASAVDLMVQYGFDGLDIDWEYPVSGGLEGNINRPEDKQNYTLLLEEIREELDEQEAIDNQDYQLTIASPASLSTTNNFELGEISEHIDFFTLMAYDYHGAWENTTNHNAPLYAVPGQQSIDSTIDAYLDAGVRADQIVLGVPAYGRAWSGVLSTNNGLFQSSGGAASGTWEAGSYDYKDLYNKLQEQPSVYTRYWDDLAKIPYIYSTTDQGGMFSSYEDRESIGIKTDYIREKGLGGIFFWDLSGDLPGDNNDSLVSIAATNLATSEPETPEIAIAPTNAIQLEANTGNTPYTFTVTRTGDTSTTSTANWAVTGTGDNPANAGDFGGTIPTGTVTFASGVTSQVITVNVSGDTVVEPEETFSVSLSNPSNATITTATATGTIRNDDTPLVQGDRQQITSSDNLTAAPRGNVSIPLFYNTSNGDNTLTGISLRLHYNSNELSFQKPDNLFNNNLFVAVEDLADSRNLDNDPQSDRYVQFGYTDFFGNWPNQTLPLKLGDFNFTTTENFAGTQVNFTSDNLAPGYSLEADPILISKQEWNFDIDGNGEIKALADGIMIVRHLFGTFPGERLTEGAIAPNATRNLAEIQTYLQQGLDNKH